MGCKFSRPKKSKRTSSYSNATSQQIAEIPIEESTESSSDISTLSVKTAFKIRIIYPSLPRETELCFQGPIRRQRFSFSDKIMYYMAKNPTSAELYQKLIQSCKYFFAVNPLIVISCLNITKDGWRICVNRNGYVHLDIDKIPAKLWLRGKLHRGIICPELKADEILPDDCPTGAYISKFYRFELDGGIAFGKQNITFDQLLFFVSAKSLILKGTIVLHENGSPVQIETIIANFPLVKECWFTVNPTSSNITINTVKNLIKMPNFLQMRKFILHNISDTLDIETLYKHLKERDDILFALEFRSIISDEYFARLETIVDELLATSEPTYFRFPCFLIPRLDQSKQNELIKRFNKYNR